MMWMKKNKGFTLVEVLIALGIFVTSFFVLVDSQNMSVRNSALAKRITIATTLAQEKLSEMVLKYQGKPLTEIPEKEEGTFSAPHSKFRWEKTSRDFHYDLSFLIEMDQTAKAKAGKEESEEQSPLMTYLPKISDFIKQSSKEITVTVYWKEGSAERKMSLTTHLFDLNAKMQL